MGVIEIKSISKIMLYTFVTCFFFFQAHSSNASTSSEKILEDADYNHVLHLLLFEPKCIEMNDLEKAQANEALNVLKIFPEISAMRIAAIDYFSKNQYRRMNGLPDFNKPEILCIPESVKSGVISESIKQGMFSKEKIIEPDLARFVFMLSANNPEIVSAIGNTAFFHEAIGSSVGDVRIMSRIVLSKLGLKAVQWSEQAVREISAKDKLGTSAASVATATGNLKGIERTSKLIAEIISKNDQKAIKRQDTDRLFELVVAMALAGDKAQPYIDPLIILSSQKIESVAPPFGIIEVSPQYVCAALKKIGGEKAEKVLSTARCTSKQ